MSVSQSQMNVFLVARNKVTRLKLNRKFDSDLVALAIGWLLQEQHQRETGEEPLTKLEMKV